MHCGHCGKEIPMNSNYCMYCGKDKQYLLESSTKETTIPGVEALSPGDIVKEALASLGWTQTSLAKELGYVDKNGEGMQQMVSNRINKDNMQVNTFLKFLSAMGCELVVKSTDPNSNKKEWKVGNRCCKKSVSLLTEQEGKNLFATRTRHGRVIKAAHGEYSGGKVQYGYSVKNGKLVINEDEKAVVLDIFSKKDSMPMQRIAKHLNASGKKTRCGGIFYASSIKKILENEPFYRGMYRHGIGKDKKNIPWVKGVHEPILVD